MKKTTKGAVATSAAALLLLGGWGTQAGWTDQDVVGGEAVRSGKLQLISPTCGDWKLKVDTSDSNPVAFDPLLDAQKLVPGNVLTRVCTFTVDAEGYGIQARFTASTPSFTGATELSSALQVGATYTRGAGAEAVTGTTALSDGDVITASLTVDWKANPGLSSQDKQAVLQDVTVTVTQV